MPTFSDIGFSRQLSSRLVATCDTGTYTPIETPQALLSRHPQSLRFQNEDSSRLHDHGMATIRHEVAKKLVAHSPTGKHLLLLESLLQQDDTTTNNGMKFTGCVSALDLLKFQKATMPTMVSVSTGSLSLDTLLGIPPSVIRSLSTSLNPQLLDDIPTVGLPWGHVMQCSGPSGSGKTLLALQIAASAASQHLPVLYLSSAVGHGCLTPLVQRLRQVVVASTSQQQQQQHCKTVLDLVSFQVIPNAHELLACLTQVEESHLATMTMTHPPPTTTHYRVLILDAASGCLTTEDPDLLQRVALRLKQLARNFNLIVWINCAASATATATATASHTSKNHVANNLRHSMDGIDTTEEVEGGPAAIPHPSSLPRTFQPALGATWHRTACDIHLALEITSRQVSVPPSNDPYYAQQDHALVIGGTLKRHPYQDCQPQTPQGCEWYIATQGTQDC